MKTLPNKITFRVKYLSPTNSRGSRVKIYNDRFNEAVTIPYDYSMNTIYEMAVKYLEVVKGIEIKAISETKEGYILISDTFASIK